MKRIEILEETQDFNDAVGTKFKDRIEENTKLYVQGVIHHEEYIDQIAKCCKQAKELILPLPSVLTPEIEM